MNEGILYGVGVGPGDPELITVKAVKILKTVDVIAYPTRKTGKDTAYEIAVQAVPEIIEKEQLAIEMPMSKDHSVLEENHRRGAAVIGEILKQGKSVAFLTLGDPSIYSTFLYIKKYAVAEGHCVQMVAGITSFCEAAAKCGVSLGEAEEPIHILPGSYDIDEELAMRGTKILMKSGKKTTEVIEKLRSMGKDAYIAEKVGMEGEHIYRSIDEIKEMPGYFTIMIVRD